MIEKTLLDYLTTSLVNIPCFMEMPESSNNYPKYVVIEKIDSGIINHISASTFVLYAYATSLYEACELSEDVKDALMGAITLDSVSGIRLNGESSSNDTQYKRYRYEITVNIYHY